jgi:hypothetical protein
MKALPILAAVLMTLAGSLNFAAAGSAMAAPLSAFIRGSHLVAVIEVGKVTEVEVPTGEHSVSKVYVAEAEIIESIEADRPPDLIKKDTPRMQRKIALVGSSIPNSSAVWEPIMRGRYLAFLHVEQGHYAYHERYQMRRIDDDDQVEWLSGGEDGVPYRVGKIALDEAIRQVIEVQDKRD